MNRSIAFPLLVCLALSTGAQAAPAGPPSRPSSPAPEPSALRTTHPLKYAPAPLDNPLKGFAPFHFADKSYEGKLPHSLEWQYFALNELMTGYDQFDWKPLERALDEISSHGRQAVLRVYIDYPGKKSGLPQFLIDAGVPLRKVKQYEIQSPDYDDPRMLKALTGFVRAFGKQYDGDPRIGFITLGLIGLWGEWHLFPSENLFPTDKSVIQYLDAFDAAFDKTELELRQPRVAGGYGVRKNMGFHDDSFFWKEGGKGVTLPQSMGGWDWSFLQELLRVGGENRWIEHSLGGEVRPEIQRKLFSTNDHIDNLVDCVELTHVTWLVNQVGISLYKATDPKVAELVGKMGYELSVKQAYFDGAIAAGSPLRIAVTIENHGVAPFYYPWRVALGVIDDGNTVRETFYTNWDLRRVKPLTIRTFPDWALAGSPREIPFGAPITFSTAHANKLPPGHYRLAMRVVNPLERIAAERRTSGQNWSAPLPLRFANAEQTPTGWLVLGEFAVQGSAAP